MNCRKEQIRNVPAEIGEEADKTRIEMPFFSSLKINGGQWTLNYLFSSWESDTFQCRIKYCNPLFHCLAFKKSKRSVC